MWQRVIGLLLLLLPLALAPAAPAAYAQQDCDDPPALAAGTWSGEFEVQWQVRWTADLSVWGLPPAPAAWERSFSLQGQVDLIVRGTETADAPSIVGSARALWREETRADREDGAWMSRFKRGWLSGGSLLVPAGRALAAGDAIDWPGAWWTAPVPEAGDRLPISASGMDHAPGRGTLFSDGITPARPAELLRFQVTTVSCEAITGTADSAAFRYPQLEAEAGPSTVDGSVTLTLRRTRG